MPFQAVMGKTFYPCCSTRWSKETGSRKN